MDGIAAVFFAEGWYQLLRYCPCLAGLGLTVMTWRISQESAAVLAGGLGVLSLLFHKKLKALSLLFHEKLEAWCLSLTPNIQPTCKAICGGCLRQAGRKHNVAVFDSFTQRTKRLLFEPDETYWTELEKKEEMTWFRPLKKICPKIFLWLKPRARVEVRTVLPHGIVETKSWLRKGRGIFTDTLAADLEPNVEIQDPETLRYTLLRVDQTKAVVQMWAKSLKKLRQHFKIKAVNTTNAPKLTSHQQMALNDFRSVLIELVGEEAVKRGTISICTELKESENNHLSMEGKLGDILMVLKEHPWVMHHYFRCSVLQGDFPGICANMGVFQGKAFCPGTLETRVVLYIRQGTKQHACVQALQTFAEDSRKPAKDFTEIKSLSSGGFWNAGNLGKGGDGGVYKVFRLTGTYTSKTSTNKDIKEYAKDTKEYALKVSRQRNNEQSLQDEMTIANDLTHKFFVHVYLCDEMFLPRADLDGVMPSLKGILMELADTSLDKEVLKHSDFTGKDLDKHWLRKCRPWMAQMVFAVSYMHEKEIVHRDLKPANFLLRGGDPNHMHIQVTDFGHAVRLNGRKQLFGICGTPMYRPPEMDIGAPKAYGEECDVYSLAKTWEAMLQRRKLKGDNGKEVLVFAHPKFEPYIEFKYPEEDVACLIGQMSLSEPHRWSIKKVREAHFFETYEDGVEAIDWKDFEKLEKSEKDDQRTCCSATGPD